MSSPFARTLRSIHVDRGRRVAVTLIVGLLLFAVWSCWLGFARLPVYVTSNQARIEIDRVAHPVQTPLSGAIKIVSMELGARVRAGDPLVELDTEPERLALAQGKAQIQSLAPQIEAAKRQLRALEDAVAVDRAGTGVTVAEAQARLRQAEAARKQAAARLAYTDRLAKEGLVSGADAENALGEHQQSIANSEALRFAAGRIVHTKRLDISDRLVQIGALEREVTTLAGQVTTLQANVDRLELEVARRVIRAPIDGELVEVAPVTAGAVVRDGERLAVILPAGRLRAVAELAPPDALGRVRVGQTAHIRLEGFPWTEHGYLTATVSRVSGEVRDNKIRVELALDAASSRIPLQHGLPGFVEIAVERDSPGRLVLRAAGKTLVSDAPPPLAGETP